MKPALGTKRKAAPATASKRSKSVDADAFNWSASKSKRARQGQDDDLIASDTEDDDEETADHRAAKDDDEEGDEEEEEEFNETADEKRVRLAREYLDKLAQQQDDDSDVEDGNEPQADGVDRIGARLHQDALEVTGKFFKTIAANFEEFEFDVKSIKFLRGHKLTVTSVCLTQDGKMAFSSSKDGSILKWNLVTHSKSFLHLPEDDVVKAKNHHERGVLAVAVSTDGKFFASGGYDKLVRVWDPETGKLLESFAGHRDTVSSLAFRLGSRSLFSGSFDRTAKHWNLTEMGYVETLYGHQSEVNGLDSLHKERVVSCGRDRSVRLWKIPEETHLVFYGNSGSMDCVKMINDEYYVTGGDDGSLSLWFNARKKPVFVVPNAHGAGNWISSVAVMPRTDLVASGSCDGSVRLWKADLQTRTLSPVGTIPLKGFVNSMAFDFKGRFLLAGVGLEHRLGRWQRVKSAKNGIAIVAMPNVDEE